MAARNHSYVATVFWMLQAALFDAVRAFARLFPIDSVSNSGAWLTRRLGPLTSAHRVAERNIRIAFPHYSDAEVKTLLQDQWTELGRSLAEFAILDRVVADESRLVIQGEALLGAIAAGRGPVVFVSGHFSNFEMMAAAMVRCGVQVQVTYRAMNNPYVDERVRKTRYSYGVRMFAPKGLEGTR
jgi:Kdo2-lipid IVA lauroyltransferase/acyltransferase